MSRKPQVEILKVAFRVSVGVLLAVLVGGAPALATVWTQVPLPPRVEHLWAMTPGTVYLFASMRDSSGADLGLFRTPLEAPGVWEHLGLEGRSIVSVVAAGPGDTHLLVANYGTPKILYSNDGGANWQARDTGIVEQGVIALGWNGIFPGRVYASGLTQSRAAGLYASTDFGATWTIGYSCPSCIVQFPHFAVPRDGGLIAWTAAFTGFWACAPYNTTNGGLSWQVVAFGESSYPADLDVSPRDPLALFLLTDYGVYRFQNDQLVGYTNPFGWYGSYAGAEAPAWDPEALTVAGVGEDNLLRVARATPPYEDWTILTEGLPTTPSPQARHNWLKFHFKTAPGRPLLFYATWGLGLWMRDRSELASIAAHAAGRGSLSLSEPWPSPAIGTMRIVLRSPHSGEPVRVEVLDLQGRVLTELLDGPLTEPRLLEWSGRTASGEPVPGGVYFIRATSPGATIARKVVLLR